MSSLILLSCFHLSDLRYNCGRENKLYADVKGNVAVYKDPNIEFITEKNAV